MSQILVSSDYIQVEDTNQKVTGLKLLRVRMRCACCKREFSKFDVVSDRLDEWQKHCKDNMQPLCTPCAKAHKKWHPEKKQLEEIRKIIEEPDPHAEKTKEKLYAIKRVFAISVPDQSSQEKK